MKRVIFILALLFLPIISAVEFDMKTEFSQGETLMAKVSGNFIDSILKENIFFYRGHVRISINPSVAKIDNEFYIYAQLLDKAPNNYSIAIENVRYMKGSQVSEEDIVRNFSITQDIADFSANPGFVITEDDFFIEVQNLQDYQINININPLNLESQESITLISGETKKINFELKNISHPIVNVVELSTGNLKYEIPVYVFGAGDNGECIPNCTDKECGDDGCGGSCGDCETGWYCQDGSCVEESGECIPNCTDKECGDDGCGGSCGSCDSGMSCINGTCVEEHDECASLGGGCEWVPCHVGSTSLGQLNCGALHVCCKDDEEISDDEDDEKERDFKFKPSQLDISMATNSNTTRTIYLYNTGQETLENISLIVSSSLKKYLNLSIKEIDELKANSKVKIKIQFFSDNREKTIEGQIKAKENGLYTYSAIFLNFSKNHVALDEDDKTSLTKTCLEMGGEICGKDQECDGDTIYAKDDKCCLGTCKKIEKSSTPKIIGWTMLIAVVVFLIWFFKTKYKAPKKEIDLFKIRKRR